MAQYRKKPVVISAVQFDPKIRPWPQGVELYQPPAATLVNRSDGSTTTMQQQAYPAIHTLEGWMRVSPGDWIITGVKGEIYNCKDDIFRASYDAVSPDVVAG